MARSKDIPKEVKIKLAQQGRATVYHTHMTTAVFPDGTSMSLSFQTWPDKNNLKAEPKQPKKEIKFEQKGDVML